MLLNYLIESGHMHLWIERFRRKRDEKIHLNAVVTNGLAKKEDKYDFCKQDDVLVVENLCKTYNGNHQALDNVSFNIGSGEVSNIQIYTHRMRVFHLTKFPN